MGDDVLYHTRDTQGPQFGAVVGAGPLVDVSEIPDTYGRSRVGGGTPQADDIFPRRARVDTSEVYGLYRPRVVLVRVYLVIHIRADDVQRTVVRHVREAEEASNVSSKGGVVSCPRHRSKRRSLV